MIQLAQILFILSVLVILHEFGHYITARMFKVRVEKFYLFMDAGFSLLKKKIGHTEWGIGWLPLGGYVKLSGMIDESMDTEQMKQEAQPWEFRSKPAWQRLIIMLGGIIVNVLLAILIYAIMFVSIGQETVSVDKIQENGLAFGEVGSKVGFKSGDKIISVDGKKFNDFKFVSMAVLFGDEVKIDRNGEELNLTLTDEQKGEIIKKEGRGFVSARFHANEFFIDSIGKNSNGLARFDEIIGINGKKITYIDEFYDALRNNKNDSLQFLVLRNSEELEVTSKIDSTGKKGLNLNSIILNSNFSFNSAIIGEFTKNSEGEKAGLELKDKIIKINDVKINTNKDFKQSIALLNKDETFKITVERDGKIIDINCKLNKNKKIGVGFKDLSENKYVQVNKMSLGQAIPQAAKQSWDLFKYNINSFKLILRPSTGAYKQVKSPVGIARQLPDEWDWKFIWNFTALFSIGLAFMNLLPIPGLDGGHALFTIAEMITGKTLNDKAAGYVQTAGMIILLTLMALTFGKDIIELVIDKLF
jgi:RIP metalloprotease RseP